MRIFAECFSSARSVRRRVSRLRFLARPCTARVLQVLPMADLWRARCRSVNVFFFLVRKVLSAIADYFADYFLCRFFFWLVSATADFWRARWRIDAKKRILKRQCLSTFPTYCHYGQYVLEFVGTIKNSKRFVPACRTLAMFASLPVFGSAHGGH